MKKLLLLVVSAFVLASLLVMKSPDSKSQLTVGGSQDTNYIDSFETFSQVTVTTTPQQLLSTSTARMYAIITNGGSQTALLNLSTSSSILSRYSVAVPAGGSYVINSDNLYRGPVFVSSTASGTTVYVLEK